MSEIILDCQGLPCPQPVLKCKKCLDSEHPKRAIVIVDNAASKENVTRFLSSQGYLVKAESDGKTWELSALREKDCDDTCEQCKVMGDEEIAALAAQVELQPAPEKIVVFLGSNTIGSGSDKLGQGLMFNFLSTLPELDHSLWRLIFVNSGIHLACKDDPCLEAVQKLANAGVEVLVCGTCLEFFDQLENKRVGETTNMLDVVTSLALATKVIQP